VHKEKLQPGDIAYLWQSGPEAGLIAVATVTTTPEFIEDNLSDRAYFLKEDALNYGEDWRVNLHIDKVLEEPILRATFVEHPVLSKSTIIRAPQGTNFLLTQEEKGVIDRLLSGAKKEISPAYSIDDFSAETGFSRNVIESWTGRLRRKMHVIIQGPPGTGKTYVAERLARLMVSNTNGFWDLVQFHPSYAYEDFIQGIRPRLTKGAVTWELEDGRFLQFCSRARQLPDAPCVLIIDEINRAHLSRVFGELMYLMEYRAKEIKLASGGDVFKIPANVFLIGTMNTADRSIALVDHALRRRFSFIRLSPDYEVLQKHLNAREWPGDSLVKALKEVNRAINDPNYELGISYFMKDADLMKLLPDIWTGEIEPYLEEYFYDQPGKVQPFRWNALVKGQLMEWSK
jgi:MoxR-like ATPase